MKRLILIMMVLLLAACAPDPIKPDQVVDRVVTVKCQKQPINTPTEFPFDRATKDMPLFDQLKLALSELEIYRGYTKELKSSLDACTE